jgi:hypothetical protein
MHEADIIQRGRDRLAALRVESQLLEIQVIMSFGYSMGEVGPYALVRFVGLIADDQWEFGMKLNRVALQEFSDAERARIEGTTKRRVDGN